MRSSLHTVYCNEAPLDALHFELMKRRFVAKNTANAIHRRNAGAGPVLASDPLGLLPLMEWSAEQAIAAALAEGLSLDLNLPGIGGTPYKGVTPGNRQYGRAHLRQFRARARYEIRSGAGLAWLGYFTCAEAAALAVARHTHSVLTAIAATRGSATHAGDPDFDALEALAASLDRRVPGFAHSAPRVQSDPLRLSSLRGLSESDAVALASAECRQLTRAPALHHHAPHSTGYQSVYPLANGRFGARAWVVGTSEQTCLGSFLSAAAASLAVARAMQDDLTAAIDSCTLSAEDLELIGDRFESTSNVPWQWLDSAF